MSKYRSSKDLDDEVPVQYYKPNEPIDPPLDPKNAKILLMVGKPNSGKSYLTRAFFKYWADNHFFKFGVVFTGTKFQHQFDYLPDECVIDGYNDLKLRNYITKLQQMTDALRKTTGDKHSMLPPNFICYDDITGLLSPTSWFNNWLANFRHTNTTLIFCAQYLRSNNTICTALRSYINYAFCFEPDSLLALKALHETFGNRYEKFKRFKRDILAVTNEKYGCFMYNADEKKYGSMRAPDNIPDFQIKFDKKFSKIIAFANEEITGLDEGETTTKKKTKTKRNK